MHSTSANYTFLVAHPEGGDENLLSANREKKQHIPTYQSKHVESAEVSLLYYNSI